MAKTPVVISPEVSSIVSRNMCWTLLKGTLSVWADCLGNTSEVEYRLLETFYSSGAEILVSPPMCPVREKDKISTHPKHMENDSLPINYLCHAFLFRDTPKKEQIMNGDLDCGTKVPSRPSRAISDFRVSPSCTPDWLWEIKTCNEHMVPPCPLSISQLLTVALLSALAGPV